ncbi:MAG: aliphatic sulfonate ABC transporter substrate-binding protein [Polaromonas sp.]|nr:aliphatic sulfonate ABC transporter substrate-binding protein [Polaromonas sp.]
MKAFLRHSLAGAFILMAAALATSTSASADELKTVRIANMKYGNLVLLQSSRLLDTRLKPLGFKSSWTIFPSGPPALEALNVGAIDIAMGGESTPIFAQAAGADLVYIGNEPASPRGEAILVPRGSALRSVKDLAGKRIALTKGSNVHYLLVRALEDSGVSYAEVKPVFLAPADARAAFQSGAVDAWVIWDPLRAAAEIDIGARTLRDGVGLVSNHQFFFSTRRFAQDNPAVVREILAAIKEVDAEMTSDIDKAARSLAPAMGVPYEVLKPSLDRQAWDVQPLSGSVVAQQQRLADTFHGLGLIPKKIDVQSRIWNPTH